MYTVQPLRPHAEHFPFVRVSNDRLGTVGRRRDVGPNAPHPERGGCT